MAKYDLDKLDVILLTENLETWTVFGKARTGNVKTFDVRDPETGNWTIVVREDDKNPEISIAVKSYPKGRKYYAKLGKLTSLFPRAKLQSGYYCPVSETFLKGTSIKRRYFRKDERKQVPSWIKSRFRMKVYGNVVSYGKGSPAKDNLVVVIGRKYPEKLVKFFIGTRIWPVAREYKQRFK